MHSRDKRNPQHVNGGDSTFCGSSFVVGQHVVCVDNENFLIDSPCLSGQTLEKNVVYTISAISTDYPQMAVQIAEHPFLVKEDGWYGHWRFRPLQKLKLEDFMPIVEHLTDEVMV